jgi:hypothetical protein
MGSFIAEDRAVALQRSNGQNFVDHPNCIVA